MRKSHICPILCIFICIASEILTSPLEGDVYDERYFYNNKRENDMDIWPKRKDDDVASFKMEAFKKLIFAENRKGTTANSTTTGSSKKSNAKSTKATICTTKKSKSTRSTTAASKKAAEQNSASTASSKTSMTCSYGNVPTPMTCNSNITTTICTTMTNKTTTTKIPKTKTTARKNATALPLNTAEDITKTTECPTPTTLCIINSASSETTTLNSTSMSTKKKKKSAKTVNPESSTSTRYTSTPTIIPSKKKSHLSKQSGFKRIPGTFKNGESRCKNGYQAAATSQELDQLNIYSNNETDSVFLESSNNYENVYESTANSFTGTSYRGIAENKIDSADIKTADEKKDQILEDGKIINGFPEFEMSTRDDTINIDERGEENSYQTSSNEVENKQQLTNEKVPNVEQADSYHNILDEKEVIKKENEILSNSDYPEEKNVSSIKEEISDYIADIPQHKDEPEAKQTIDVQHNNTAKPNASEEITDYDLYKDKINAFLAFKKLNNNRLKDLYTAAEPIQNRMNSKIFNIFDNNLEGQLTKQRLGNFNKSVYANSNDDITTYSPIIDYSSDSNDLNSYNGFVSDNNFLTKLNPFELFNFPAIDTLEINDGILGKLSEIFGLHKMNKSENNFLTEPGLYSQNNMSANHYETNNIPSNENVNNFNSYPVYTSFPTNLWTQSNYNMKEKNNKFNLNQPEFDKRQYDFAEQNVPTLESILQKKDPIGQNQRLLGQWNDNKLTTSNEYRKLEPFFIESGRRATYKNPEISQVTISNDINDKKILEMSDKMPEFTTKPSRVNNFKITPYFVDDFYKKTAIVSREGTKNPEYNSATTPQHIFIGSNKIFLPNKNIQFNEKALNSSVTRGEKQSIRPLVGRQFISNSIATSQPNLFSQDTYLSDINKKTLSQEKGNFELENISVPTTFVCTKNNLSLMQIENNINEKQPYMTNTDSSKMFSLAQSSAFGPYDLSITENQENTLSSSLYTNIDLTEKVSESGNYNPAQLHNKNYHLSTSTIGKMGIIDYNSKAVPLSFEIQNITPMHIDMPPSLNKNDPEWKEWIPINVPKGSNSSNENKKKSQDTPRHHMREEKDYKLSDGILNMMTNNPFEYLFKKIINIQDKRKYEPPILHKISMNQKENADDFLKQEYVQKNKKSKAERLSSSYHPIKKLKHFYPIYSILNSIKINDDTNLNQDQTGESSNGTALKFSGDEGFFTNQNTYNGTSNSFNLDSNFSKELNELKIQSFFENIFKQPNFSTDEVIASVKNRENKNYFNSDDILHNLVRNSMLSNIINNQLVNQSAALILSPINQSTNIGQVKNLNPNGNVIATVKLSEINIVHKIPSSESKEMPSVTESLSNGELNLGIPLSKSSEFRGEEYNLGTVPSTTIENIFTQLNTISDQNNDKSKLIFSSKVKFKQRNILGDKLKGINHRVLNGGNMDPNQNSMIDFLISKPKFVEHEKLNNISSSKIENEYKVHDVPNLSSDKLRISGNSESIPIQQKKIYKFGWKDNVQSLIDENNNRYANEGWHNNFNRDFQLNEIVNRNLGHLDLDRSALVKYLKKENIDFLGKTSQSYNNKMNKKKRNVDQKRNFEQKMKSRELEYIIQRNLPTLPLNKDLFINYMISGMKKSGETSSEEEPKPQKYSKNEIQSVIDRNARKPLSSNTETRAKMKPPRGRFMHRWPSNSSIDLESDSNKLF